MTPELSVPLRGRCEHDPRTTETVSHVRRTSFPTHLPRHVLSCENEAFVRDFPPNLCDIHCFVTSIALWQPLPCDIHCFVTSIALWHTLLCDIHCFVTSIALWHPLLHDSHCTSIAIRNTEVRPSNVLWQLQLHYVRLHYTNYTSLHYTTLHSLHFTTLHSITLHHNYNYNYNDSYNYNYN